VHRKENKNDKNISHEAPVKGKAAAYNVRCLQSPEGRGCAILSLAVANTQAAHEFLKKIETGLPRKGSFFDEDEFVERLIRGLRDSTHTAIEDAVGALTTFLNQKRRQNNERETETFCLLYPRS